MIQIRKMFPTFNQVPKSLLSAGAQSFVADEAGASESFRAAEVGYPRSNEEASVLGCFLNSRCPISCFFPLFYYVLLIIVSIWNSCWKKNKAKPSTCRGVPLFWNEVSSKFLLRQRLIFRIESREDFDGRLKAMLSRRVGAWSSLKRFCHCFSFFY